MFLYWYKSELIFYYSRGIVFTVQWARYYGHSFYVCDTSSVWVFDGKVQRRDLKKKKLSCLEEC